MRMKYTVFEARHLECEHVLKRGQSTKHLWCELDLRVKRIQTLCETPLEQLTPLGRMTREAGTSDAGAHPRHETPLHKHKGKQMEECTTAMRNDAGYNM